MTLPRSVADVVSRHVLFEIESIDRMYCNLYVPQLQRAEGLLAFIHGHLGHPIASTSVIAPMSRDFLARLAAFAGTHGIPRIDFARGQRKDDVMHEYLAAFDAAGRTEGVLFIGRAQENNTVFRTEKRRAPDGRSYPWIVRTTSVVNQFYVHCVDEDFGAFFIKFSSYFPYGGKLLINGHHYAQVQAATAGIGFAALDNGFAAVEDPAAVQAICDSLTEDKIEALARKWLAVLPSPYSSAGLIFGRRIAGQGRRPTPGRFRTRVITEDVTPSLHVGYKNSKIKQYHKLGKAIRTETTIDETRKAHTFEPTCARRCLKLTGLPGECPGPGRLHREGRRPGPCRALRTRAWGPGWRRGRRGGSPAASGIRCRPGPARGRGTGRRPGCCGSWCGW